MTKKRSISIYGATGAVGRDTLATINISKQEFKIELLTGCDNVKRLIELSIKYKPTQVIIANQKYYQTLKEALKGQKIKVAAGKQALIDSANIKVDRVVMAISGMAGLKIAMQAIENCDYLIIASKELLIAACPLIRQKAEAENTTLLPIDSEHCALYQLIGDKAGEYVEKLVISASGGVFFDLDLQKMKNVTVEQACKNPNWNMGRKISVDSANLMNKGLEIIEAAYFFDIPLAKIDIVVHRQSVLHAMAYYIDGSVKAGMSCPDMRSPIAYGLHYPQYGYIPIPRLDLAELGTLDFSRVDYERFPSPLLMRRAGEVGRYMVIAINAANEIAVAAFLDKRIGFLDIYSVNARVFEKMQAEVQADISCSSIDDILSIDFSARDMANKILQQF